MAAVTAVLTAAGIAANAAMAAQAQKQANKDKAAIRDATAKLQGIKEADYLAGLQVPTLGYDLAQQSQAQRESTMLAGLEQAGTEAVIGGVPNLVQQGMEQDLNLSAGLQQAEYEKNMAQAQNAQNIETRRMTREYALGQQQLEGAQNSLAQNRQNVNDYIAGALQVGLTGGLQMGKEQDLYKQQPTDLEALKKAQQTQGLAAGINSIAPGQSTIPNGLGAAPAPIRIPGVKPYIASPSYIDYSSLSEYPWLNENEFPSMKR